MLKIMTQSCLIVVTLALIPASSRATDQAQVKRSIDAAINYLKNNSNTAVANGDHEEGPLALAGLALIEAGVPANDPVILAIAKLIRERAITASKTYQLSIDIIFLDRLGEQIDTTLIQSMGVRLLAGQFRTGGWSYHSAGLDENEQNRLKGALNSATMKGGKELPQVGTDPASRPRLDPGVEEMLLKGARMVKARNPEGTPEDNSNTQFALIALWSARRHGVPVEKALHAVEARFRATQTQIGAWNYIGFVPPTPSMTCAGLLGLAVASGIRGERSMRAKGTLGQDGKLVIDPSKEAPKRGPNPLDDPSVKRGIKFLEAAIAANGNPGANAPMGGGGRPGFPPGPGGPPAGVGGPPAGFGPPGGVGPPGQPGGDLRNDFYFLWSLERVCVVFGLKTIGGRDWHSWGADYLLTTQNSDGSWRGKGNYGSLVDTSFGLLFMLQANIVKDLTRVLKGGGVGNVVPGGDPKAGPGVQKKPDNSPPVPVIDPDVASAANALVSAGGAKQMALIKEYGEAKGAKYSIALSEAIPKLSGDAKNQARDALANRMARLSAKSLQSYLQQGESAEIRRAAAFGIAMRDEKSLIPVLIDALDDTEEVVWRAARASLRDLTGKDFGPKPGDSDAKRQKAITDWQDWWKKNSK